jgi:hypothetical protein
MSPSRLGEDGIPMTCLEVGWIQDPENGNDSCLGSMFNSGLLGSLGIAVN